jgi:hypothetical protein
MVGPYQPQSRQTMSYWSVGGALPPRPPEPKRASKKALYLMAVVLLLVGLFMIYKGATAAPPKISVKLGTLGQSESAIVGIVCKPCGTAQETSLQSIVGKDNYRGIVKNALGQEIMLTKATGDQVQSLATREWVRYMDRVE